MEKKINSIKKNVLYNIILRVSGLIFPILTLPYVYRVLNVADVGSIEFSISFVQYFIILSQLGIPIYAIRECSKHRGDINKFIKTAQEILFINILTSLFSFTLLIVLILNITELSQYKDLLFIFGLNIFFTNMGLEWFFQALEEYRFITFRSVFVKIISIIMIFLVVKSPSDYLLYGSILVFSNLINGIINIYSAVIRFKIHKLKDNYNFKRHIKAIIVLSAISLSIVIYTNLDKTMLGLLSGNESVGLYAVSYKIISVILSIITALGMVLLPRLSYYIGNKEEDKAKGILSKAFKNVLFFSIPAGFGVFALANNIILIMSGGQYVLATKTLQLLSPIIVINGLANISGIALYSFGKEKITLVSTTIGAIVNVILNLILIPIISFNGAAIATLIAEFLVLFTQIFLLYKFTGIFLNIKEVGIYIIGGFGILLTCNIINTFGLPLSVDTIMSVIISAIIYLLVLYIRKDKIFFEHIEKLINLINKKRRY